MCEQQYFAEYVLGWRGPSGQKADKGTITHKILEILAVIKKGLQDNASSIDDNILGNISTTNYDLDDIISRVYKHYSEKISPYHKWSDKDLRDCRDWTNKAISFNGGMFDPRNRNIICPEQHFDFEIDKPWSKYSYNTIDGRLEGNLALKGTIDLITLVDDDTIEIIDWKTGKRRDWATGKEKTQENLEKDPQLMIYYYAIKHLYPDIKNIIFSIYFINDGGPFSVCFSNKDILNTEDILRAKFEIIKKSKKPRLNKTWMCSKLCHFGKTTFENTNIEAMREYRDNQRCPNGSVMTKCEQLKHEVDLYGIDTTMIMYTHPNHSLSFYKAPG